jgi:hypothetical protein
MQFPALPDLVIALGYPHWCAVLLVAATDRDEGIAVIDTNGDGNCIYADYLVCLGGVWSGNGGSSAGSSGQTPTLAYACGEAEPGSVVAVEFLGNKHRVITQPSGWWAFAARVDDPEVQGPIPRRV